MSRGTNHEAVHYVVSSVFLFLPALRPKRSLQHPLHERSLLMSCLYYTHTLPTHCKSYAQPSRLCNVYAVDFHSARPIGTSAAISNTLSEVFHGSLQTLQKNFGKVLYIRNESFLPHFRGHHTLQLNYSNLIRVSLNKL